MSDTDVGFWHTTQAGRTRARQRIGRAVGGGPCSGRRRLGRHRGPVRVAQRRGRSRQPAKAAVGGEGGGDAMRKGSGWPKSGGRRPQSGRGLSWAADPESAARRAGAARRAARTPRAARGRGWGRRWRWQWRVCWGLWAMRRRLGAGRRDWTWASILGGAPADRAATRLSRKKNRNQNAQEIPWRVRSKDSTKPQCSPRTHSR